MYAGVSSYPADRVKVKVCKLACLATVQTLSLHGRQRYVS